jgi:UDP-N-acetylglucosamine 4-epimerase
VGNVVLANHLAALSHHHTAGHIVYNIACGEQISLLQLHDQLIITLGKFDPAIRAIKPVFLPIRKGDIMHSKASISKARKWLGYQPVFSFSQGIERAMQWYRENLNIVPPPRR